MTYTPVLSAHEWRDIERQALDNTEVVLTLSLDQAQALRALVDEVEDQDGTEALVTAYVHLQVAKAEASRASD